MRRIPGRGRKRPTTGPVSPILVRLPLALKARLDVRASAEGISLAAFMRNALAEYLSETKPGKTGRGGA